MHRGTVLLAGQILDMFAVAVADRDVFGYIVGQDKELRFGNVS